MYSVTIHLSETIPHERLPGIFERIRLFGQLELCPTTGRHHLQCLWDPSRHHLYPFNRTNQAANALRSELQLISTAFCHPHTTVTRDVVSAIKYCSKPESRVAGPFGFPPYHAPLAPAAERRRNSSSSHTILPTRRPSTSPCPISHAIAGTSLDSFLSTYPQFWRSISSLSQIWSRFAPPPICSTHIQRTVIFIFGPPGLGKTTLARTFSSQPVIVNKIPPYIPPGYNSSSTLIFDDVQFVRDSAHFQFLLSCMHDHSDNHRILHGSVLLTHKNVILTSNTDITTMCDKITDMDSGRLIAFRRRITHIIRLSCSSIPGRKFDFIVHRNVFDSSSQNFSLVPLN